MRPGYIYDPEKRTWLFLKSIEFLFIKLPILLFIILLIYGLAIK